MANEIMKYDSALDEIQAIVKSVDLMGGGAEENIKNAVQMASATNRVRELVSDDMMKDIMALQGTPLGFKTDRDRNKDGSKGPGYPLDVVREAFIQMCFYGLQPVNNQWNIIAGNAYIAKNGMTKIINDIHAVKNFQHNYSIPKILDGYASVRCYAKWEFNGEKMSMGYDGDECEILVEHNKYMSVDAILGKVERKFKKRVIERMSGCSTLPEGDVADFVPPIKDIGEVKSTTENAIESALEEEKSAKELLIEMFSRDCDGDTRKQKAIVEEFTGKASMTGSKPEEYQALWDRVKPDGSERESYETSIMALMREVK